MTLYPVIILFGASKTLIGVSSFHFNAKWGNFLCYERKQDLESF
jgi:hypothetical protein